MPAIDIEGVAMRFGDVDALKNVSLHVLKAPLSRFSVRRVAARPRFSTSSRGSLHRRGGAFCSTGKM